MALKPMPGIYAEGFKEQPYWWEAAAPTFEGSVPLPHETDVAVIGAGYAGLSVALELARNDTKVAVIEQSEFGTGASTRNGGAVSSGISIGRGLSGERNRAEDFLRGAAESFDHIDTIIMREGIDCGWQKSRQPWPARRDAQSRRRRGRQTAAAGAPARGNCQRLLPRRPRHREIGQAASGASASRDAGRRG
jgi:glycine/D-amino acid oxidase-like deaminating enzyme